MDTGSGETPVARMRLSPEGTACGVGCAVLFIGFFVWLAISNLLAPSTPLIGHAASILWLAIVAFVLFAAIFQVGLRMSAIEILGAFAKYHFVELRREGDRVVIGFGYQLFGRTLYYLQIEGEWVVSVNMNTGQATNLAGRDMNDWHVALWYRDPNVLPKPGPYSLDRELYLVGRAGAKAPTAEFLQAFVAFLRAGGVELHPTEKDTEFRAASEPPAVTPDAPGPSA
jgi:hypothetical protein